MSGINRKGIEKNIWDFAKRAVSIRKLVNFHEEPSEWLTGDICHHQLTVDSAARGDGDKGVRKGLTVI